MTPPQLTPKLWALKEKDSPGLWALRDENNARGLWQDDPDLILLHRESEDAPWVEVPREV